MHLFELLSATAREYPDAEAFICEDSRCTYAQLHDRCSRLAAILHELGVCGGIRVALVCCNGIPFVETVFALLRLGAVCVPLNWRQTEAELGSQLEHADTPLLLHDEQCSPILPHLSAVRMVPIEALHERGRAQAGLPRAPLSSDKAAIIFTAGTSAGARAVLLTHDNLLVNSASYCAACGFGPGQRELAATQLFHISTFSRLFTYVRSATACCLMKRFDPPECFNIMRREAITSITQTPTMYRMLQQAEPGLKRAGENILRVITGASAMSPAERQDLHALFPNADLYDIYGQTEASPGISVLGPRDFLGRPDSVGMPMPGVSVAILDATGRELAPGTIGEITVAGPNVMKGYFRNAAATREVLVQGRLHTGDMGYMDADGFLYIAGRKKDIIITGGINVFPPEVENVLGQHPDIIDCAVFGVPDETWGEAVIAAVVLREATAEHIQDHCRRFLPGFKCPKKIFALGEIPRNAAGKAIQRELVALWTKRPQ